MATIKETPLTESSSPRPCVHRRRSTPLVLPLRARGRGRAFSSQLVPSPSRAPVRLIGARKPCVGEGVRTTSVHRRVVNANLSPGQPAVRQNAALGSVEVCCTVELRFLPPRLHGRCTGVLRFMPPRLLGRTRNHRLTNWGTRPNGPAGYDPRLAAPARSAWHFDRVSGGW